MEPEIATPDVEVKSSIKKELLSQIDEEGQVLVHCTGETQSPINIRIWPTTYLYDHHSAHESEMVQADRITVYPIWTQVPPFTKYHFSLLFSGLPKSCRVFDLKEVCGGQAGAFEVLNIERNDSDVYWVKL